MAWVVGIGAFLLLLFAFPRQMGAFVMIIIAGGVALWGYSEVEISNRERQKENMQILAKVPSDYCKDPKYPIELLFINNTGKSIDKISFTLSARRRGFSGSVYNSYLESDRILKPNDRYMSCWSINQYDLQHGKLVGVNLQSLDWLAGPSYITFTK